MIRFLNGNQIEENLNFEGGRGKEKSLVAEIDLQKKLVSEAPRGTIFAILIGKLVESKLNHNSSNHGKPAS